MTNSYDIRLDDAELHGLSYDMSYMVSECDKPVTSPAGMEQRDLNWIDKLMTNSCGRLPGLVAHGESETPSIGVTAPSVYLSGNFSRLPR